jgi:lipopolysaccharide transport system ATP-binding protein
MSDIAIRVDALGKRYRIGERQPYKTLRDTVTRGLYAPLHAVASLLNGHNAHWATHAGHLSNNVFWALKDVSFEVKKGDVLGIIGPNGAGKSTLLKILSRITKPTEGYIRIHGRIGSLLEVGTGFHPELTGRENIYLNGSIIGMRKKEIDGKFDEIVAFAEIEKFIDSPVKFYSSGMYIRLAFAVAAHLQPQVLLVDEVLAVGDLAFQKKCLGKMGDVAKEGRTVLFVSHNLGAVKTLCGRALWLTNGHTVINGLATEVVATYITSFGSQASLNLEERREREGNGRFQFTRVQFLSRQGWKVDQITSGDELKLRLDYRTTDWVDETRIIIIVSFRDEEDRPVVTFCSDEMGATFTPFQSTGTVELSIPNFLIRAGDYNVSLYARNGTELDEDLYDRVYLAASLKVIAGDVWKSGRTNRPGPCALIPASLRN